MSSEVLDVWNSGMDVSRCKTPALYSLLSEAGVTACGSISDDLPDEPGALLAEISERDAQRVRLAKRLAAAPEGIMLQTLVSEVCKGQRIGECERFDGSDPDYQFVYRFLNDLRSLDPPLAEKRKTEGLSLYTPTHRLLDLISEGITQTHAGSEAGQYDRQFCENLLKTVSTITPEGQDLLEDSLHRYLDRIEDYRLLFDVHLSGRGGHKTSRMTKGYKTRFNSQGRIRKEYARFNQSLEYAYEAADNAVLCTLTTDPGTTEDPARPDPRPLWEQISSINENFNRLMSYMASDPETILDSRAAGAPAYCSDSPRRSTGRPRERLSYLKALEFTEKGYPHLHVIFFDVPTRVIDGMPWLIDKAELSDKWSDYGQGMIVDLYPLVYRDDLDEIGNFGSKKLVGDDGEEYEIPVSEGFVDWIRYGDHDHGEDWIAERIAARYDDPTALLNFHDEDPDMQSRTAGSYIGKYLSATFGSLLEATESLEEGSETHADKAATWKLGLYWATRRRFWSISRDIQLGIKLPENLRDPVVRQSVREISIDSVSLAARSSLLEEAVRGRSDNLDEIADRLDGLLADVVTPAVESTLPDHSDFVVNIEYLGCYAYWDMPRGDYNGPDLEAVEDRAVGPGSDVDLNSDGPKPPPIMDVWNATLA